MSFFGFDIPEITRKLFFAAFPKEDFEPEEPKELPISTSSEIIIGYRWWRVQKLNILSGMPDELRGNYRLVSMVYPIIWQPGKEMNDKKSLNSQHTGSRLVGVQVDNHAGVHAYNHPKQFLKDENIASMGYYERNCITTVRGEVYLWGKVICCEYGYRAQYGYPHKIFIKDSPLIASTIIAASLRRDYGIEVDIVESYT